MSVYVTHTLCGLYEPHEQHAPNTLRKSHTLGKPYVLDETHTL